MELERNDYDSVSLLKITGQVDLHNVHQITEALEGALNENKINVVVDMEDVEAIDSSGLGALIGNLKIFKSKSGTLAISGMSTAVKDLFNLTRLTGFFQIFETSEEALKFFQQK